LQLDPEPLDHGRGGQCCVGRRRVQLPYEGTLSAISAGAGEQAAPTARATAAAAQPGWSFTGNDQEHPEGILGALSLLLHRSQCALLGREGSSCPHRVRGWHARRPRRSRADVYGLRHRHGRGWLHERGGLHVLQASGLPDVLGPAYMRYQLRASRRATSAVETLGRLRSGFNLSAVAVRGVPSQVELKHHLPSKPRDPSVLAFVGAKPTIFTSSSSICGRNTPPPSPQEPLGGA